MKTKIDELGLRLGLVLFFFFLLVHQHATFQYQISQCRRPSNRGASQHQNTTVHYGIPPPMLVNDDFLPLLLLLL